MITEFRLPDLGEGLREAEIVQWHVAAGDEVTLNQTIAEVETAKAVVELPSPFAGTVSALHHAEGDVVPVGEVLIAFDVAGAGTDAVAAPAAESRREPNLVGYGAAPRSDARPQRRARAGSGGDAVDLAVREAAPHDAIAPSAPEREPRERPRSTPPVRKLAKDLGVDLDLVAAHGIDGLITREDVESYAARTAPAPARTAPAATSPASVAPTATSPSDERIPIRGVRKHTADAMVRSAFTAPHAATFLTVDVTASVSFVAGLRADRRYADARIGIMAVAAKAVCLALRRTPELNATWDEAAGEIVRFGQVNLGIAAATDRGLVVPSVKDAGALSLVDLAQSIRTLADTARAGKATPADLSGGTFSITNYGVFGVDAGTPILVPGEAGILGLGAVQRRPWEHEGAVALREVMTLSLSFDHRLVDGAEAARFLTDVADVLREPGRAMVFG